MDLYSHPFGTLENEYLRLDYLTDLGPCIIGLYAKPVDDNLFAVTPEQHWPTPHGEYYLHGGHRLWTAPEDPFYTCPEDQVDVIHEEDKVILRGGVDASGLEKEIAFHLQENCVSLVHQVTWHGREPIELAPWAITQVRLGGMSILPQSTSITSLLPNRNLVLWPYSRLNDERLDLHDDLILVQGRPAKEAFKIGNYNPVGWIAYILENILFTKRFSVGPVQNYPDLGCSTEIYVKDTCVELETLGILTTLEPQESITFEETWEVHVGDYLPTLVTARMISNFYI